MAASFTSFSQIKLGEVACVYVTTANLDSSVALYEKIGFEPTNEMRLKLGNWEASYGLAEGAELCSA